MLTPHTLQIWLTTHIVLLLILVAILIAVTMLLRIISARRRAALIRERAGYSEDGFVQHLSTFDFDPRVARTTYRYLQNEQKVGFPISLNDELAEDLGLKSSDVRQTVQALLAANDRVPLPAARSEPIASIEDLIRYIQAAPRRQNRAA